MIKPEFYYWLAINGASCAASSLPIPASAKVEVSPTPEQLIGFPTREEQLTVQKMCLEAPMDAINTLWATLPPRIRSGEVIYRRPENPESPTRGQTLWSLSKDDQPCVVDGCQKGGDTVRRTMMQIVNGNRKDSDRPRNANALVGGMSIWAEYKF